MRSQFTYACFTTVSSAKMRVTAINSWMSVCAAACFAELHQRKQLMYCRCSCACAYLCECSSTPAGRQASRGTRTSVDLLPRTICLTLVKAERDGFAEVMQSRQQQLPTGWWQFWQRFAMPQESCAATAGAAVSAPYCSATAGLGSAV
jgi:hypothetical protein